MPPDHIEDDRPEQERHPAGQPVANSDGQGSDESVGQLRDFYFDSESDVDPDAPGFDWARVVVTVLALIVLTIVAALVMI